jgi:GR25 family glycosyltransferase involved in LPS biosynthesis
VDNSPIAWSGHYVNLDRAKDRRASIEKTLGKAGLSAVYQRFSAVVGDAALAPQSPMKPAEIGCFRSHASVVGLATRGLGFVHVLEDDAILSSLFRPVIAQFFASGMLAQYDLVFTDIIIAAPHIGTLRHLKATYDQAMAKAPDIQFSVLDLRDSNFGGANSYFINPASAQRVSAILEAEYRAGPNTLLDMVYRREVQAGRLRAAVIFPFVSRVDLKLAADSAIGFHFQTQAQALASDIVRTCFCVEYDPQEVASALAPLTARKDRQLDHLAGALRVMIGG